MAEMNNGRDASKNGFFSKILRSNSVPDLEEIIASGAIPETAERQSPAMVMEEQAVSETPHANGSEPIEQQMEYLHAGLAQVFDLLVGLHEKEAAHQRVFDTLYTELHDYKNDFFYERLKPIVRPLLFLYDSLEQYQQEIAAGGNMANAKSVGENIAHFLDQLTDVLAICEVQPMSKPEGEFDPKLQKAVDIVTVAPEAANQIQRVVRGGWTINGSLLRPAEVIVGKAR